MISDNRKLYYVYAEDEETWRERFLVYAENEGYAANIFLTSEYSKKYPIITKVTSCAEDVFALDED